MHVGMGVIFQNPHSEISDAQVYANDLKLADMAEPLGYESIWTAEHHITGYMLCPDPLQFLTYMAGRTKTVKLGTMVTVLPWHDPLRLAEQISLLDTLSDGRFVFAFGRGTSPIEFDAFRLDMGKARQRFVESAEAIMEALETGVMEYSGSEVIQPRAEIRPAPIKTFKGRVFAASSSPETMPILARLGTGLLIIPQKPWDIVEREVNAYCIEYERTHQMAPPPPVQVGWTLIDKNADRAYERAKKYLGEYYWNCIAHYKFGTNSFAGIKGYEYQAERNAAMMGEPGAMDKAVENFLTMQPWGTPEMIYDTIVTNANRIGSNDFTGVFSFGGIPHDEAEAGMRLFAKEVMPELKKVPSAAERLQPKTKAA